MFKITKLIAVLGIAIFMSSSAATADAMVVTGVSPSMMVADKTVTATDQYGKKIKFVADGKVLRLMSADGQEDFMSFNSFDGIYNGVDFNVRAVETNDPSMRLFEITAVHSNGRNCGYWLVGQKWGLWTTFVSWNSFKNIGFHVNQWHRLESQIENQQLVVKSYDAYGHVDFQTQILWDASCEWFGLKRF